MSLGTEYVALLFLLLGFSPVIVGLSVMFLIKNRQSKKIIKKSKETFQEIFGL